MDIYVLDELLRRTEVIDQYESLIWTERYSAYGDFELVIRSDRGVRALLPVGTRVAILQSYRVMVVETIENGTNDDGVATLKVSGRSIESILLNRITRSSFATNPAVPDGDWNLAGAPGWIARKIFDTICRSNAIITQDNIPYLQPGTLLPAGTIAEPTDSITVSVERGTVYDAIKSICDMYNLGFRLIRNGDTTELYFEVYTGDDRTTLQTLNSTVVFSQELDNLSDTKELTSLAGFKNVAYVFSKNGSRIVYADGVEPTISGFERNVLVVDATSIETEAGTALQAELEQKGKEELAKNRPVIAFDGQIPQFGSYVYGLHYDLGDLVETRNADGLATNMRVTEQIFVSDKEGERSYPTLTIDLLITPGSWYAWDAGEVWDDADGYWADA